jgi:hypothetical protein
MTYMKPAILVLATVACLVTWSVGAAEAVTISVDAVLDHPDLSFGNPINWSVMFPPVFFTIERVTLDSYWVGDGLDVDEVIIFEGLTSDLSGVGFVGLVQEVFFRSFTLGHEFGSERFFLDGSAQGRIVAERVAADPFPPTTTATFERLVFTVEGEGTEVPEPCSLLSLAAGILAGARKWQRPKAGAHRALESRRVGRRSALRTRGGA